MSKLISLLLILVGLFSFIPQIQPVLAAPICQGYPIQGGGTINWSVVDSSGNPITFIPEGQSQVRIVFTNLPPGHNYYLEFSKTGFAYRASGVTQSDGTILFTVTDSDELKNGPQNAKLGDESNQDVCEGVNYTIGYTKDSCAIIVSPNPAANNQKFVVQVHSAPSGRYAIRIADHDLMPGRNTTLGYINVGVDGKGITDPLPPLDLGNYPIYLAIPLQNPTNLVFEQRMCQINLQVVAASSDTPTPICAVSATGSNYSLKAFNLKPNVDYDVTLNHDGDSTDLGIRNSDRQASFDQVLNTDTLAPGSYTASAKDADNNGCDADTFTINDSGGLDSGAGSTGGTTSPAGPTADVCIQDAKGVYRDKAGDPCSQGAGQQCTSGQPGIQTAIGCVPTDPQNLVQGFLRLGTGFGGGIAFLLMIAGAFQMITSAGNAEALKEGQQRFINAIIGLLFIIFSILLLKIIGVDILGLGQFLGIH